MNSFGSFGDLIKKKLALMYISNQTDVRLLGRNSNWESKLKWNQIDFIF
jgi:hypothetical protein